MASLEPLFCGDFLAIFGVVFWVIFRAVTEASFGVTTLSASRPYQLNEDEFSFQFSRSSGAGGQNVNKVNSKAELRWEVAQTECLPPDVIHRFMSRYRNRLDADGLVVVVSERHRDRERNRADCIEKLCEWIDSVWEKPKPRIKTKPTKGSKRRRIQDKRHSGEKKRERAKFQYDPTDHD